MGESSRNYQNGKIYCIRNNIDDDIYVGSTTQPLSKRMAWHRDARNHNKKKHLKIYQKMSSVENQDIFIELLEEFPCDNVEQLRKREGEYIRNMKPVLNQRIEGRTVEEWRKENEDRLKERSRHYYENNKDQKKIYQERNKDRIKQQTKIYQDNNKDKIRERKKKYYEKNKDQFLQKVVCECGSTVLKEKIKRHQQSYKHQQYIQKQESNDNEQSLHSKTDLTVTNSTIESSVFASNYII